jgi:hypothetical protein
LCQGLEPFNLDKYRQIRGDVTWRDLAQFVTRGLAEIGAKFTWQNDLLSVEVPELLRQRPNVLERYDLLTFDRRRAMNSPEVELAGIGHPLVDVLLQYFRSPAFNGLTCIRIDIPSSTGARSMPSDRRSFYCPVFCSYDRRNRSPLSRWSCRPRST